MTHKNSKKISAHHDEDESGEELWLVSYADMVTLLFGFFVILFSFSSLDDKKFDDMKESVAQAFKGSKDDYESVSPQQARNLVRIDPQIRALQTLLSTSQEEGRNGPPAPSFEPTSDAAPASTAKRKVLSAKILDLLHPGQQPQTLEISLPEHTLFDSGSYELTPEAKLTLAEFARSIKQFPNLLEIQVSGHTDSLPPAADRPYSDNLMLSSLRASVVGSEMVRNGTDPYMLTIQGFGDLKPLLPEVDADGNELPENQAQNRRVSIVLKMKPKAPSAKP